MYLRTANEVIASVRALMRDATPARWSVVEMQQAINQALRTWAERVWVPMTYEVPGGWAANQNAYVLPAWMPLPVQPQYKRSPTGDWIDLTYFDVESNAQGQHVLRWAVPAAAGPARILWQYRNQGIVVQASAVTLFADNGTWLDLVIGFNAIIPPMGIVRVQDAANEREWVLYQRVLDGDLYDLTRQFNGSPSVVGAVAVEVMWGIAATRLDLFDQLHRQVAANLHEMYLHGVSSSSASARSAHQQMVSYYRQQEAEFWAGYHDYQSPKLKLNRKALFR